jgi:hypothetical protein
MTILSDSMRRRGFGAIGAGVVLAALMSIAAAQQQPMPLAPGAVPAEPPPVQMAPPAAPVAAPPSGLLLTPTEVFSGIGRLIDKSIENVNAGVKGAGEALGGVPNAAGDLARDVGDAAGTIARLPATNVVKGWQKCAVAPNGAPDCEVASIALCQTKGFQRGRSLDITSAHKCPAQMWREGRQPNDKECVQESFVSQALCQ